MAGFGLSVVSACKQNVAVGGIAIMARADTSGVTADTTAYTADNYADLLADMTAVLADSTDYTADSGA